MTNKEIIERLKQLTLLGDEEKLLEDLEAIKIAIKALEERPTGDLISREDLKKVLKENEWITDDPFAEGGGLEDIIDNAPTVEADVNCSHCDYFTFSKSFIENMVKFMADYKIESVEALMKELNHINEWLGGKDNEDSN